MQTPQLLRNLDVDDLFIMACLYEGIYTRQISPKIGLSFCSVRRRIDKIEFLFGEDMFVIAKVHRNYRRILSEKGRVLGLACKQALELLLPVEKSLPSPSPENDPHLPA